jgi:hypothetical protein
MACKIRTAILSRPIRSIGYREVGPVLHEHTGQGTVGCIEWDGFSLRVEIEHCIYIVPGAHVLQMQLVEQG